MQWEKRGLIFRVDNHYPWMVHHACVPTAEKISDKVLRIYYGPRDAENCTVVAFIEVDADNPSHVLRVHDHPAIALADVGTVDDTDAVHVCIVNQRARKYI